MNLTINKGLKIMNTQKIYAIYDDKAETYNSPFPLATDGLAIRAFQEGCKDPRTDLYKYPGDFSLYCIATWDYSEGKFENIIPPKFLAKNVQTTVEVEISENETKKELDKIDEETKSEVK